MTRKRKPYFRKPAGPTAKTRSRIARAAVMHINGQTWQEIAAALGMVTNTARDLPGRHPLAWRAGVEEAEKNLAAVVLAVQEAAGTQAVMADPGAYLRMAELADKWATAQGEPLFSGAGVMTLTRFWDEYYRPMRLSDAASSTLYLWWCILKRWRLVTANPPIEQITAMMLARYRDFLASLPGMKPGQKASPNTVADHMRYILGLLNKAGPAGPGNRDAAGLLDKVPWVKYPSPTPRPARAVPAELLNRVYRAAEGMTMPQVKGIPPCDWWRALLVLTYNTGLRRRTLFELRMDAVDWAARDLVIPPANLKSKQWETKPLNETAYRHLVAIRGPATRERLFPWDFHSNTFTVCFHRLQNLAGIPREQHFGLHSLRKTHGTLMWEHSPQAAQFALGHRELSTTRDHYVDGGPMVARALDKLPQPEAFAATTT